MKPIIINDKIYGQSKISEPVLIELIKSKPVQRLKRINQHGTQGITEKNSPMINRYEHSIGVMLLLKKYNADLEEQIAGLLHDISHTAFSHVVDHALGNEQADDFHEKYIKTIIYRSKIPQILKKHNLSLKRLLKANNLLEKDEPDLCADRIDYFLRDSYISYRYLNKEEIKKILQDLKIINNHWAFTKQTTAKFMAKKFIYIGRYGWYRPSNCIGFLILGRVIKKSLQQKLLKEKDLFTDDKTLLKKLSNINQPEIRKDLKLLKNFKAKISSKNYDYLARPKFRAINPYVFKNNKMIQLSILDPEFKKDFLAFKKYLKKGIPIKIVKC